MSIWNDKEIIEITAKADGGNDYTYRVGRHGVKSITFEEQYMGTYSINWFVVDVGGSVNQYFNEISTLNVQAKPIGIDLKGEKL